MMKALQILIAGEGANELGRFVDGSAQPGVIEAFIQKVRPDGFRIVERVQWKQIRKLRANVRRGDAHAVKALVLRAREQGRDVLVFLRDRDGNPDRERSIRCAVEEATKGRAKPGVAAGVPIENLECWILAVCGERQSQKIGNPGAILASKYGITHTAAMVQAVGNRKLSDIPDDATSLHTWIGALFRALGVDAPARL